MKLTDIQERRIAQYLRDTHRRVAHLPESARRRAIAHVKAQLREKLEPYVEAAPKDDEFERILRNCRMPAGAQQAREPAEDPIERIAASEAPEEDASPPAPPPVYLGWPDRIWLGVCAGLAARLQVEPAVIRVLAVILGVVTGGLLLWAYLAAFFVARQYEPEGAIPVVDAWWPVLKTPLAALGLAVLLYVFAETAMWGMSYASAVIVGHETAVDSGWRWFGNRNGQLVFFALVNALPLAAMSGLPVIKGWDETLHKLAHACVAIYALILCIGLAAFFAGHVLAVVQELTGVAPSEVQAPPIF